MKRMGGRAEWWREGRERQGGMGSRGEWRRVFILGPDMGELS